MGWSPGEAEQLATRLLADLPVRLAHVRGVAGIASEIADRAPISELVVSAAWLHDIGYARPLAQTGFHALDGARYLASRGAPGVVVSLVAYHSGARYEAVERGMDESLARFAAPAERDLDILTLADLSTAPDGARVSVEDRLAEILARYPVDDPVHEAVQRSGDELRTRAARASQWIALQSIRA